MPEWDGLEARLRGMEEALERIGTSFDERATWRELAGFVFRTLCDAAAVDVIGGIPCTRTPAAVAQKAWCTSSPCH